MKTATVIVLLMLAAGGFLGWQVFVPYHGFAGERFVGLVRCGGGEVSRPGPVRSTLPPGRLPLLQTARHIVARVVHQ